MQDIEIHLENKPGMLALLGETLGRHQISLEGGGIFQTGDTAVAHYLVEDGKKAKEVLETAGIGGVNINRVVIQRLRQDMPGQLGLFCRNMAMAGVNILVQYSDHSNQLVLVVDDFEKGKAVSEEWKKQLPL